MRRKTMFIVLSLLLLSILILGGCGSSTVEDNSASQNQEASDPIDLSSYKNADLFITPYELQTKLGSEDLVILDTNKPDQFASEHIPGAINIGFHGLSKTLGKSGDRYWGTTLDKEDLKAALEKLGVTNDKLVVIYSDVLKGPGPDGRNVWQLRMAGLDNVKLLYGGLDFWEKSGYEVTDAIIEPVAATGLVLKDFDESYYADLEYVSAHLNDTKIIDCRTKKEFDGAKGILTRGGHIKGAVWLEWKDLLNEDATPKKPEEIIALMNEMGITPEDDFVVY